MDESYAYYQADGYNTVEGSSSHQMAGDDKSLYHTPTEAFTDYPTAALFFIPRDMEFEWQNGSSLWVYENEAQYIKAVEQKGKKRSKASQHHHQRKGHVKVLKGNVILFHGGEARERVKERKDN